MPTVRPLFAHSTQRTARYKIQDTRHMLSRIFNPKSIAVIGATPKPGSVGLGLFKNVIKGMKLRKIYAINPFKKKVLGFKCLPLINSVREKVDLAIIAVPAAIVPKVVKECCEKKVGGIIIISSGFAEIGEKGRILQEKIIKMVRRAKIPLIGPNVLGIIRPSINLNASFAPASPRKGGIAFVSQSGALIDSIIDKNLLENYGFSTLISYGNEADLSLCDFLLWLDKDKETKVIAIYLEGIKNGRRFFEIAKRIRKPIIAIKAGRLAIAKKAAMTHTASLAGDYKIFKALFKQTGIIKADTIQDLFDIAKALSWQPKSKNGIGVITNGGGCAVLAADYFNEFGIKLPELISKTLKKLKKSRIMHPACSFRNPLDIVGDALSSRYKVAIEALLEQENIYGLLIVQTLQIMTEVKKNAKIIIEAKRKWPKKPIVCAFLGGKFTQKGVKILEKNKIPNYQDLKQAVLALRYLVL